MKQQDKEKLREWVSEQITRFVDPSIKVKVLYKDRHDDRCGITSYQGNNSYIIKIFSGKNLEEIRNKMDVEMFKDTVLHELAHIRADTKNGHEPRRHDKLWKEEATRLGAIPRASMSKLEFKLLKEEKPGVILCGKWKILKGIYEDERGNRGYAMIHKNYYSIGNAIVECPKCKRKWVVNWMDGVDYYCCYDEVNCVLKELDKESKYKVN
jgi:predicted SprT family Zn-dependent metalloprotease